MKSFYTPFPRVIFAIAFSLVCIHSFAATFTVTNLNDAGVGSLRQAIINANAAGAGPHAINFAVAGTIPITSSLPAIANSGITIDGGGAITINAQGGDVDRRFFIIKASNTTVKGFTLQNTGSYCFDVAGGLSNVTIQDIIANHVSAFIDNVVLVTGASTNMTIKNVMVLSGMQDCVGSNIGRPFYFQNGLQTNLLIEDITAHAICEGIVFRDASVNGLNILNTTIYGSINHIVFDNTGGPVETANNVVIDGENTASLYSQRDGGGSAMIYSDFVNTNWQIKNIILDGDRANTVDDANYGIRFDNSTNGITIDEVLVKDFDVYSIWFNGAATNITIDNTDVTTPTNGHGTTMQGIRFENTVTTLSMNNVLIDMDISGTTDDANYGIVFAHGHQRTGVTLNNVTINEADVDGIYVDGPVTNFTVTASTFTNNYDGIEFYNGYNHINININNSTFTGSGRSGILINTGSAINSGTISGNTISNNASNGLWFYSGNGNKAYTVSGNTISFNGGAGIYVNSGPDAINITQNSIFRNTGNGIELDGGGNLSYEGVNRPTVTGSTDMGGGMWKVNVSLPTICNAAGGCTVEVFANNSSDDVEGRYFVQSFSGLAGGSHVLTVASCTAIPCTGFPYGFWTATLKVVNTGSVSEFSNKQSMKTQGPAAVDAGVALWLDAQDALSGNLPGGTGWQDRSGNDRDFDLVFGTPNRGTSGLNYNHYVQFNGGSYLRSSKSPFVNGFTAGEVIVVTRAYYRHLNQGNPYDLGGSSRGFHYSWGDEAVYNGFGTNDRLGWRPATNAILDGKTGISAVNGTRLDIREWNIFQTYSAAGAWGTGFNGQFVATTTTNMQNFSLAGGNEHIGAVSGAIFYGDVAEVIMYSRTLTTVERQKVNSYLALKYGTSLDQIAVNQDYFASDWNGTTGTRMWQNDNDGYETNIFGIGRDNNSGFQQKQSESTEQNAILSVAIGSNVAASNEANTATIGNNLSFLTFADNNQLQRFGPAVTATNSNFRFHRVWKTDKINWADANVTFNFGEDFAGNYLLISSNATFTGITSELLLNANGSVTFNSSLLAHGSYFTVGAKMQLPGCVTPPVVSYPNYQEYYNNVHFPFNNPVGYGYNTNLTGKQDVDKKIAFSGYYARNFSNSFNCDNCSNIYRAKLNITNAGTYTFYVTSDDNGDIYVDGDLVASVYTCCYTASGTKTLTAGVHDIEVRQSEGGGADYVTVEYQGPSVSRQVIPLSALVPYTAPGVQTWLKADEGVVTSGTVTRWNDVSGNNNDAYQTNATWNPTYNSGNAINFNPAVSTTGGQGMIFKKTIPPTNNVHLFAVGTTNAAHGNWNTLLRGVNTDHPIITLHGTEQLGWFDNNNVGYKGSGLNLSNTEPKLFAMSHTASANSAQPRVNGKNGTVLTNINEDDIDYLQHFMNGQWQGADQSFGRVSEFVAVSGTLSATDIQKIESYLALKYGITIDQTVATNYLATTGTMWVNDGDAYKNDIAGIGKDLCQNLHQKQSKSVNGDDPITIAIGDSIMPTNAANAVNITNDLSFLTWANNDGNTTAFNTGVSVSGILSTTRIPRIWKVDKTNFATQNITLNFSGSAASTYLLISSDPTFATIDDEFPLNAAGNVTFSSADLPHGAYFTFGKRVAGPACVNAGIQVWLRGDYKATTSSWSDFSGNAFDAAQASVPNQPIVNANSVNFNPGLTFASNKWMENTTAPLLTRAAGTTLISVQRRTSHVAWADPISYNRNGNTGRPSLGNTDVANQFGANPPFVNATKVFITPDFTVPFLGLAEHTAGSNVTIRGNGGQYSASGTITATETGAVPGFYISEHGAAGGDQGWAGDIVEVISYNRILTTVERQRVESYLSLKYGLTLNNGATDYLASDGSVYWNDTDNTGYGHDIAGIGRDDCTNLNQKQSRSVNPDDVITVAAGGSVAATNATNAATITNDKSFLLWSNNNGATTFTPAVTGLPNATVRMSRIWKVEKTANWADQNITLCASQVGERYLLLSADATFGAGDTEKAFNFGTGCITFNSSELGDGSYFTIATKIVGPACVNSGVVAWLRADYGANGAAWSDFSGNNNNPTATSDPDTASVYINFNRAYYYDGNDVHTLPVSANLTTGNYSIMTVSRMEGTQNGRVFGSSNGDNKLMGYWGGYENQLHIEGWLNGPYGTLATTNTKMYSLQRSSTGSGPWEFRDANRIINSGASSNGSTWRLSIGAWRSDGAEASKVYVPEVAIYNIDLAAADVNKIESYFALKYGMTLNQTTPTNYIASNGTTVMWNATDNTGYNSNIAGIGRDDCTDLYQKQSKSVNTGEILTGALGSAVATSNAANMNTITTDLSFLVWGNNNGLNEFTTQVTGTNVTAVLGRVWRVDKTNWTDQNITLCFDNYNDDDYLVISNASPTFATINQEKQLSALGCVTFNSSELPDGAYFSLGKSIMAPGCVTGGIVTWLDAQTVASGNMINGVGWSDKSGNDKFFNWVFGDPTRTDAALNYNHVINFDGTDWLRSTQSPFVNNFTAGEVLIITKSGGQFVGQGNPYDFGSGNRNEHYSWSNSYLYNAFGTTDNYVYNPETNVVGDNKVGAPNPALGTFYTETNWNLYHTYSAPSDWGTGFNGLFKATTATNTVNFGLNVNNEHIGDNGSGHRYTGDIAEVILYRRKLTAPERQKVMSYLALKYGMTLDTTVTDQDYVAANGTIFWDWADNNNYQHDIAGIGRDDCQKLHQKQSKSINGDDPLAIAVGNFTTFPTSNEANTASIADDESFLVWSNNNGGTTFTTSVPKLGINATFHTPRKWRISKTSFTDQMLTISVGQTGERYLLVDEDGSGGFENDANTKEYAFNFSTGLLNINSLNLPDGAVIALGTKIAGPGCVNVGIRGWFRADYGASATQWTDFSGNSLNTTATGAGNDPAVTEVINFNPAIDFDGNDVFTANIVGGFSGNQSYTIYSVFSPSNTSGQNLFAIGSPATQQNVAYHPSISGNRLLYHFNDDLTATGTLAGWQLGGFQYNNSLAGNDRFMYSNGTLIAQNNAGTLSVPVNPLMSIGGYANRTGLNGDELVGDIAEFVVYNTVLTAAQRQQVESYLALKYGITLNNGATNYIASNGSTIYWDVTTNTGYNTNIAGIGLDICTELYQKQSKSINTGEILTGALGNAIATTNAANTTAFADSDLSFLVWGHNNGVNDFNNTVTATGTVSMAYLGRVWRAQKTNFSNQNITLCFNGYDTDDYLLISNSSAIFATVNHEAALDANGCITINSSLLRSGAYFTLGKNLVGPACVDGGIKLWLRADDGSVADSLWADYSGNSRDATQATLANRPPVVSNVINFNPGLSFNGSTKVMTFPNAGLPTGNSAVTLFAVATNSSADNNCRAMFGYGTAAASTAAMLTQCSSNPTFDYSGNIQGSIAWNKPTAKIVGGSYQPGSPNVATVYDNGRSAGTSNPTLNIGNGIGYVGDNAVGPGGGNRWNGNISEVVIYNRVLTATERQQVNSYLALKYGITLDQTTATDYIASDGSNIWNASDNGAYKVDIAGLGKDICTGLDQKQSKSVNANSLITMALGSSVAATNADNPNTITNDKSFFVWANNGLATTFSTAFTKTGSTINLRTPRIWKVDKTNWADQDITICVGQTGERSLIIDNGGDANFLDDSETSVHALDFSTGCVTISSSLLPDGAHFSLGTEIKGPACVDAGIKAWYRADYGAMPNAWTDFSGNSNNANQATVVNQPAFNNGTGGLANFNPYYTFDGTNDFMDANTFRVDPSNSTVFAVGRRTAAGAVHDLIGSGAVASNQGMEFRVTAANRLAYGEGDGTYAEIVGSSNIVTNGWYVFSATQNNGTNGIKLYQNYGFDNQGTVNKTPTTANLVSIGSRTIASRAFYWPGQMTEVVIYDGVLSDAERQRVESYLSLKYGITMNNGNTNYIASDGTTIYWDASANSTYHNNVAGIGRDSCTSLLQKQSKSVNTGEILTVALGSTIEASNALNTNTITADRSFLVWGHNNGSLDFLSSAGGTNATARMSRVWKVQKTNWTNQNITMKFNGYDDKAYLIIHATDPTFATTPLEYQLSVNGEVTFNTSDLPDGAFFTLGKNLLGPACVNGGIKVWLRADDGSATGAAWNDYSNNEHHFTQTNVGLQAVANTNSINFNPGLTFTNDEIVATVNTTNMSLVSSDFEMIAVGKTAATNTNIQFPYASTVNGHYEGHVNNGVGFRFHPNNTFTDIGANGAYSNTIPHIFGGKIEGNVGLPHVNGKLGTTPLANARSNAVAFLQLGRRADDTFAWAGDITEYIVYNRALSATERQKVNSYLALKYGITLDMSVTNQDYIASDSTNIWDWSDNSGYRNDVAGIGRGGCNNLHQKKNKTGDSDAIV